MNFIKIEGSTASAWTATRVLIRPIRNSWTDKVTVNWGFFFKARVENGLCTRREGEQSEESKGGCQAGGSFVISCAQDILDIGLFGLHG